MNKDKTLTKIYLKIHHKQPLTMDDLRYLAQYAPECFEKTCKRVVNKAPETKPIMETVASKPTTLHSTPVNAPSSFNYNIDDIIRNLKLLEANEFPLTDINAENVKNLLGNTYMELLLPYADKEILASMAKDKNSFFDTKI